jgi:RimJ/RimL family protein N-acetyltransferase
MPLDLIGQHTRLRPLEERDLAPLVEAYRDLDLQLTTDGDAPPMSDVQVRAFWGDILTNPGPDLRYFAIEALPTKPHAGQMVGACSLQHIDLRSRHAELSIFMIAREVRGLGYGADAVRLLLGYGFHVLRLDKVYLGVYEFNEGGIRAYEKVGFRYEGRLRQMLHYQGRYWDEWQMGILRREWDTDNQPPADGLRPYHHDDLTAALGFIQSSAKLPDEDAARALLRRWWRQYDRTVYGYQVNGALVGLLTLTESGEVGEMRVEEGHRAELENALRQRRV